MSQEEQRPVEGEDEAVEQKPDVEDLDVSEGEAKDVTGGGWYDIVGPNPG